MKPGDRFVLEVDKVFIDRDGVEQCQIKNVPWWAVSSNVLERLDPYETAEDELVQLRADVDYLLMMNRKEAPKQVYCLERMSIEDGIWSFWGKYDISNENELTRLVEAARQFGKWDKKIRLVKKDGD